MITVGLAVASLVLQAVAAGLSLYLIRVTRMLAAWSLVSLGLVLMTVRRALVLVEAAPGFEDLDLWNAGLATVISALLVGGVGMFIPVFRRMAALTERLRESSEQYRDFFETAHVGIYRTSPDGTILMANPALVRMMGFRSFEDLASRNLENEGFGPHYSRRRFREQLEAAGEIRGLESQWVRGDGTPLFVRENAAVIRDPSGRVLWYTGTVEDISDRRQAERALRESEERNRAILNAVPDLMFRVARDGTFLDYHAPSEQDLLVAPEAFLGRKAGEVLPPDLAASTMRAIEETCRTAQRQTFEYRLEILGEGRYFEARTMLAASDEVLVMIRDISIRRRALMDLAAERERLAVTLQAIADGVITTDTRGRVVSLNLTAERLTGWSQDESVGRPLDEVYRRLDPHTRRESPVQVLSILSAGGPTPLGDGLIAVRRDGQEREVADLGSPIRDAGGQVIGAVVVVHDITDRRKMETERLRAQKLESIGVLAGGIAHDFNNILTAILGNVSLARMQSGSSEGVQGRLEDAERALGRARELTQQLLTFSKGGAPVKRLSSVSDLIRESAAFALRGSNVRCDFALDEDLWPVEVDPGQISQVIQNLVVNADEAMPEGGTLRIEATNVPPEACKSARLRPGPHVRIAVRDHGVGIPPENLPRIFDPYFTTRSEGSGLGLAICYSVVRNHGGEIRVESEPGKGSTFEVLLPAAGQPARAAGAGDAARVGPGHGRVLLVDDQDMILDVVSRMLGVLGYETEAALDGEEALRKYREALDAGRRFDAVLLDLTIPGGMGGKDTMRRLLELDPGVRGIVASGYSQDPVLSQFREFGFRGVVTKPFQVQDLGRVLGEVLGRGGV